MDDQGSNPSINHKSNHILDIFPDFSSDAIHMMC